MATITIRNLDNSVKKSLRIQAAFHDRSMEEEARIIIKNALQSTKAPDEVKKGLGSLIHQRFQSAGGVDLTLPARNQPARKPDIL
jgi:antitoxin FitA